ncbi:RDD family protein [Actinocorallia sp. API 0066]|uniref:RDD family protein n=1 Tax=Actinocorallia sp. API 0066 TaxID=2896846 RepID=UPI001E46769D|nr:RDD family protein [Actinocorallia sp. API 0066]MCD0453328.1 RDD family protein [Actinocorallia sp. API 0066]
MSDHRPFQGAGDYYALLGVPRDALPHDVSRAVESFRLRVLQDVSIDTAERRRLLDLADTVRSVLLDPEQRARYNATLSPALGVPFAARPAAPLGPPAPGYHGDTRRPPVPPPGAPFIRWPELLEGTEAARYILRRFVAACVDQFIWILVLVYLIKVFTAGKPPRAPLSGSQVFIILLVGVLLYVGYGVMEGTLGYSPGKGLFRLRVVHGRTGLPLGPLRGVGRVFAHIIDYVPCQLGYLWPLFDRRRQTFSDMVCETKVVPR